MNLSKNLNDFNRRMVEELRGTFAANVTPFQTEDEMLVLRGPIEGHEDPKHIGTHVAVSLDQDVRHAMELASIAQREEMTQTLLSNLGTQVKYQYHPQKIGLYALDVIGTMKTINGLSQ